MCKDMKLDVEMGDEDVFIGDNGVLESRAVSG